jgi:hypothetical protein
LKYLHCSSERHGSRRKGNPVGGGVTGPTLSVGGIASGTWSSTLGVGRKADDLAVVIVIAKSRAVKTGSNVEEPSEEGRASKSALLIREHFRTFYGCRRLPLWSTGQGFWIQIQRSRVPFPALQDLLRTSTSGTGSTQPREYNVRVRVTLRLTVSLSVSQYVLVI